MVDRIHFPIDFNPIGLDYVMTYATFNTINDINLRAYCQPANYDSIVCGEDPKTGKPQLEKDGILQLVDGTQYKIYSTISSGSFGTTAIVHNSKDGGYYCLKRQIARDDDDELDAFKEAMMHHILDINTRPFKDYKSDLIPRLYHVVRSDGDEVYIYFIMDLMASPLSKRLDSFDTYHGKLLELMKCLSHITPTLQKLYAKGLYNHGDLHTKNVMLDRDGSYKIIDYGFSRIRIEVNEEPAKYQILALNTVRNGRSDESRDLTQLILAFELSHKIDDVLFTEGSFEHGVQQLIKEVVYKGPCSGLPLVSNVALRHNPHEHTFIRNDAWSLSYRYFNKCTNTNGTHLAVQRSMNALPRSNAAPSPFSHRPVSAFSAARAAVTASVRQVYQDNPGVMLINFIIIIAFAVGYTMYIAKGGRDPINSLKMYHLSKPVIPSKHVTYESMSFPTHSIQMKSFNNSKTRTNSKTRANSKTRSVSKKNNTRRRSHKIPYAKIEDFDKLSLVSFYHFLRFQAFPGVSQKEKKEMLKIAVMVPLQRPDVFAQIVEAVKEKDMDYMIDILEENKLDLSKLGMEIEPYQELLNTILDEYFKEKDSAFDLLQTLLHVGGNVEDFLKRYHSADKETKKMMVMQTCITASDCPELMLE